MAQARLNYAGLFDSSPVPYLVLDTKLNVVGANRAYLSSTGLELDDVVGRWAWDAFPTDPDTLRQSIASCERAIRTGEPDTMARLRFEVPRDNGSGDSGPEARCWSITHVPVLDDAGEVELVMQHPIDVTELEQLRHDAAATGSAETGLAPERSGIIDHGRNVHAENLALKADSDRLRSLFQLAPSPIAILTGPDLVVELANEACQRFFGRQELVGRPLMEALPELAGQHLDELMHVLDSGKPFVGRGLRLALQPREPQTPMEEVFFDALYQPLVAADGSISGIFCQISDVTDAWRAQEALRESQERLHEGMDAARMVVWEWDHLRDALQLSDNAASVLGGQWDDLPSLLPGVNRDDFQVLRGRHSEATRDSPRYRGELRFERPDNDRMVWLEIRATVAFSKEGKRQLTRGVLLDITERKQAEEELRRADQSKDEFLAMLAHELRNPLAPIRTGLTVLGMSPSPEAAAQTREVMERQLGHMVRLVDDLLDIARISSDKLELRTQRVDLRSVIHNAVEISQSTIDAAGHQLYTSLPAQPLLVEVDPTRMAQVIGNLLTNAAKYTPRNGRIEVSAMREGAHVCIRVCDNGVGLAPEALPRIFDLFSQVGRTLDRSQGGLGIGLALAKRIVEMHGGSVEARSAGPHCGSSFSVRLPVEIQDPRERSRPIHADGGEARAETSLRVLVVDDNVDAADTMQSMLELLGHETRSVHTGLEAVSAVDSMAPDVVFLDIGLPDIDGYEAARRIRSMDPRHEVTLVALTGWGADADLQRSSDSGIDRHLTKPADPEMVRQILASYDPRRSFGHSEKRAH
ncbi:MAG: PAS domain-containing protein [Pseudomonadota bacterium]|nr:PAS domain-containing protein [Pseudomonadota bacterium]